MPGSTKRSSAPCLASTLLICLASSFFTGCDSNSGVANRNDANPFLKNNSAKEDFAAKPGEFKKLDEHLYAKPLATPTSPANPSMKFESLNDSGIVFKNTMTRHEPNIFGETGSGVAIADYDNDGLPDVYLTGSDVDNRLFRNLGNFKFEDVTDKAGVDGRIIGENVLSSGATFADIDNDGDLDLYVCNMGAPNLLYVNQNDGTFLEQTKPRGADYSGASKLANFCDYDRDGDLDFYLTTYQDEVPKDIQIYEEVDGVKRVIEGREEFGVVINGRTARAGEKDWLYRNRGDGTFEKLGSECGIDGYDANLGSIWFDYDNDGWQDLYVSSDFKQSDHLYKNNRDGTFSDVLGESVRHTPWFSMGLDAADLNNDGLLDLMVGDMADPDHYGQKVNMGDMATSGWFLVWGSPRQFMQNCMFVNAGNGRLMEQAAISGLSKTDWTWAVRMVDLDNDGMLDVYVTNGHARDNMNGDLWVQLQKMKEQNLDEKAMVDFARKMPTRKDTNMVFHNKGQLQFEQKAADWGLDHNGISHAAAFADLDGDGDLDAIVNNFYEPASVYRNDSGDGNRVLVQLRCDANNHFGIGSKVELWQGDNYQRRDLMPARGYLGSDPMEVHFGLAKSAKIDRLKITWPDGTSQEFSDLDANHVYRVIEAESRQPESVAKPAKTLFAQSTKDFGINFQHQENDFDDFAREPLLPYQLSRLGGSVSVSDVNNDGFQDLFCGGASGQAGQLFINRSGESYEPKDGPWNAAANCEDMGSLFFDADQDGDMDLYVCSGGNEFEKGAVQYLDRLYLNDGDGNYSVAEEAIPDLRQSSSTVCAADFDRDGDLDLFVGSRSVPGEYPLVPTSALLINELGKFRQADDATTGGVSDRGLVNSAIWSDFDNDGWVDLILALEWGPIAVFKNREGKLVEATSDAGLDEYRGWWHGIAAGDLDADGDIDYVVTNQGNNTKYHTSPDHPHRLYYHDFDKNGTLDLVEAEFEGETEYPVRGRSCSSRCMPFIADKFATFHDFSKASLSEIYETDKKEHSFLDVTMLETVVLWNDGEGFFDVQPLGPQAQSSPAYGVSIADFDGDSHLDILMANNFFGSQPETGYMDGGLSLFIKGNGDKTFEEIWPNQSGVSLSGDSNGLAVADVDGDGDLDALFAVNNEPLEILKNNSDERPAFVIELNGSSGNPGAVGAKVTLELESGKQVFEVTSGGSYLAQSQSNFVPVSGKLKSKLKSISVQWPIGESSVHDLSSIKNGVLRIKKQDSL